MSIVSILTVGAFLSHTIAVALDIRAENQHTWSGEFAIRKWSKFLHVVTWLLLIASVIGIAEQVLTPIIG